MQRLAASGGFRRSETPIRPIQLFILRKTSQPNSGSPLRRFETEHPTRQEMEIHCLPELTTRRATCDAWHGSTPQNTLRGTATETRDWQNLQGHATRTLSNLARGLSPQARTHGRNNRCALLQYSESKPCDVISAKHRQVQPACSSCSRRELPSRCDCRAIKVRSLVVSSSAITQHRQLEVTNLVRCRGCPAAVVDRLQPRQGEATSTAQC